MHEHVEQRFSKVNAVCANPPNRFRYLKFGEQGLNEIFNECEILSPLDERRTVSDNELISVVESLDSISSITKSVEYIRHTLGISASYERIRETILNVRNKF